MAVTVANSTTYSGSFAASHTVSAFDTSGTDTYLLNASFNKNPATQVTTVTADGSNMTKIGESINANVCAIQAYGIIPSDTSTDIVVSTPSFKEEAMIVANLNGVNQTTPYNTTVVTAGTFSGTATASITGTSGSLLIAMGVCQNDRTVTASNCTQVQNFSPTTGIGTCFMGYLTADGTSQTLGFTMTADNWRLVIVEFFVAGGGASPTYPGYYGKGGWF